MSFYCTSDLFFLLIFDIINWYPTHSYQLSCYTELLYQCSFRGLMKPRVNWLSLSILLYGSISGGVTLKNLILSLKTDAKGLLLSDPKVAWKICLN